MTRVTLLELSDKDLGKVDEALDVGVNHDVDLVRIDVSNFVGAKDETGVVDENVDILSPFRKAGDEVVELLSVLHVKGEGSKVASGASLTLLIGKRALGSGLRECIGSTSGEDDIAAGTGKEDGSGFADTARSTSDEHCLVV